jgi:hypothetical protein
LREKTPQSILWIASSPFGGGAEIKEPTQKANPLLRFRKCGLNAIYYCFVHAVLRT